MEGEIESIKDRLNEQEELLLKLSITVNVMLELLLIFNPGLGSWVIERG